MGDAGGQSGFARFAVTAAVWSVCAAGLWLTVHKAASTSPADAATTAVVNAFLLALLGLGASGVFRRPNAPPASFFGMLVLMVAPRAGQFFGAAWLGWSAGAVGIAVALVALAHHQRRPEATEFRSDLGGKAEVTSVVASSAPPSPTPPPPHEDVVATVARWRDWRFSANRK